MDQKSLKRSLMKAGKFKRNTLDDEYEIEIEKLNNIYYGEGLRLEGFCSPAFPV